MYNVHLSSAGVKNIGLKSEVTASKYTNSKVNKFSNCFFKRIFFKQKIYCMHSEFLLTRKLILAVINSCTSIAQNVNPISNNVASLYTTGFFLNCWKDESAQNL